MTQSVVSFSQSIVKLDGPGGRCSGICDCVLRQQFCEATLGITVSQSRIGQSVVRVFLNRLLIVLNGFVVPFHGSLIEEMEAFQIELISCRVFSVSLRQALFLFTSQLQRPCRCYLF